ncbi:FHA domain-containing protein [Mycobacterium sp. M1]|uniref:FHA domain-containing protein n=1 Tax=Mycolicibacter acidiphilus TaxID=2835306 RepID=A0ABS5RGU8_9MYCO|nr:FHA domain-containing protein [Mycolicibacter acidiphilus]MBS9532808.1 FHA domain-containing protein [Mycolicibacter acidiphilus]
MSDNATPGGLVVRVAGVSHTVAPDDGPVTIGRDAGAGLRVDDSRISRLHLQVAFADGAWRITDTSMNGMYLDGERTPELTVDGPISVRLANPVDGPEVAFELTDGPAVAADDPDDDERIGGGHDVTTTWEIGEIDPGVARAGAAAAARRRRLDISQRSLAADGIINAGALIAFEKGRSWPRERTRTKLEELLRWPTGTIARIRAGDPAPGDDVTHVLSHDDEVPLLVQAVVAGVDGCDLAIAALPPADAPDFPGRLTPILVDLHRLEAVAVRAIGMGRVTPALTKALSTIRRHYDQLMILGATAPDAPLAQRLYAARRRANLSLPELAQAGGIPEDLIRNAEAGDTLPGADAEVIEALISQISWG